MQKEERAKLGAGAWEERLAVEASGRFRMSRAACLRMPEGTTLGCNSGVMFMRMTMLTTSVRHIST